MAAVRKAEYPAVMNPSRQRLPLLLLALALFALLSAGCQTSKGFGKDVEHLGDKIQEKSK
jgi:predicted small secreted protein